MLRKIWWTTALAAAALAGAAAQTACTGGSQDAAVEAGLARGFGLYYLDEGASAKLAYGQANSDNVGLMLQCTKGSRAVEVSDLVRSTPAPTLALISAGARTEVKVSVQPGDGQSVVTGQTRSAAPALSGFRRSGKLEVAFAGLRYGIRVKPAEKPSVERFFADCEKGEA